MFTVVQSSSGRFISSRRDPTGISRTAAACPRPRRWGRPPMRADREVPGGSAVWWSTPFLDAVKNAPGARRPHRALGLRHLQGAAPQGPHGPQPQNRRTGRGSAPRCAGLQTFEAPPQPRGPRFWRDWGGRALGDRSRALVRPLWPRCDRRSLRCREGVAAVNTAGSKHLRVPSRNFSSPTRLRKP